MLSVGVSYRTGFKSRSKSAQIREILKNQSEPSNNGDFLKLTLPPVGLYDQSVTRLASAITKSKKRIKIHFKCLLLLARTPWIESKGWLTRVLVSCCGSIERLPPSLHDHPSLLEESIASTAGYQPTAHERGFDNISAVPPRSVQGYCQHRQLLETISSAAEIVSLEIHILQHTLIHNDPGKDPCSVHVAHEWCNQVLDEGSLKLSNLRVFTVHEWRNRVI